MKTLLDAVRVEGESESIQLVCPQSDHAVEILLSGPGTFTNVTVDLYGSVSGTFFQLISSTTATASNFTDGGITVFATGKILERVKVDLSTFDSGALATASLVANANPASGESVVIDGVTYKFQTASLATEGFVIIGASAATSIINLRYAVNGEATGFGTLHNCPDAHESATASTAVAGTMVITATDYGESFNAIVLTGSGATLTWSGALMAGGTEQGRVSVNYTPYPTIY